MDRNLKLFDAEYRFACIVWESEPIQSRKLAQLCEEQLGWKRSTTYTVLRKLCEKGILKNEHAIVTALVTKEQIQQYESHEIVEKAFEGSLPKFLTAFLGGKKLKEKEIDKIKKLLDEFGEED
jgi:predicted transcriptional regulator